jgi:hypothetical protein
MWGEAWRWARLLLWLGMAVGLAWIVLSVGR